MRTFIVKILLIAFILGVKPNLTVAAESGWNEVGARTGLQVSSRHGYFHQYEIFAVYGLPWQWRGFSGWGLTTQANTAIGVLENKNNTGFIGSLGTGIIINKKGTGFSTDLGININLLDKRHFGAHDFGSILQFGAYLGVNYTFFDKYKLGYRIQHISNGHIFYQNGTPNPGLDTHMLAISYLF